MFVCASPAFSKSERRDEREKALQISFIDGHLVLLEERERDSKCGCQAVGVQVVLPFCGIVIKNYDYDERGAQQLKAIQLGASIATQQ